MWTTCYAIWMVIKHFMINMYVIISTNTVNIFISWPIYVHELNFTKVLSANKIRFFLRFNHSLYDDKCDECRHSGARVQALHSWFKMETD